MSKNVAKNESGNKGVGRGKYVRDDAWKKNHAEKMKLAWAMKKKVAQMETTESMAEAV